MLALVGDRDISQWSIESGDNGDLFSWSASECSVRWRLTLRIRAADETGKIGLTAGVTLAAAGTKICFFSGRRRRFGGGDGGGDSSQMSTNGQQQGKHMAAGSGDVR